MKWKSQPIVAFDTETTGLEPFGGDRIIEFAAVVFHLAPDGSVESQEEHSWLINPGIPIPRKVTEITGISDGDVVGAPSFPEVAGEIRELLAGAVTVAHNLPFDLAFLSREFQLIGSYWPEPLAEIDTVDLSMVCFPDARSHRLSDVCDRLGVTLEGAHRATNDAEACGLCFITLARRHEIPDDLQAMLDWARAIGRPPEDGPFGEDEHGRIVFRDGPHAGEPVAEHPIHLQWLTRARVRRGSGWQWRYPESARRWARRWLDVRGAGRARQHAKSFHELDWVIDSCVADSRQAAASPQMAGLGERQALSGGVGAS